jgi:hypothetical protein
MSPINHCLPPSSSLPPLRRLQSSAKEDIAAALQNLQAIYCPLRLPPVLLKAKQPQITQVDSGYASEDEIEDEKAESDDYLAALRADDFEKNHTIRWLTGLLSRVEGLPFTEEECADIIDEASFILASFTDSSDDDEDYALTRDFSFTTSLSEKPIKISLNDAPLSGTDHTDVGLQSWGASIVFSELMCASPNNFGIDELTWPASIIELGAGTGLISLAIAKITSQSSIHGLSIVATDYHPAVLENLKKNVATNFADSPPDDMPVDAMLLDWSKPPPELESTADMLFAADVVYAPEHARWLRDCAMHLLKPEGIFWLIVTVRTHGKFEGIPATAEAAFDDHTATMKDGRAMRILQKQMLEKKQGIGRGDESGYMLFKIGWLDV